MEIALISSAGKRKTCKSAHSWVGAEYKCDKERKNLVVEDKSLDWKRIKGGCYIHILIGAFSLQKGRGTKNWAGLRVASDDAKAKEEKNNRLKKD